MKLDHDTPLPAEPDLRKKVAYLSTPEAYGEGSLVIETIETHMSWLFLTPRHVFKLKKPICNHLMDFSTPAARQRNSLEEIRLNRRLAAQVYIDLVPLSYSTAMGFALGGDRCNQSTLENNAPTGKYAVVDWLVKMRRLPAHSMLDYLLINNQLETEQIISVATMMANFYATQPSVDLSHQDYFGRFKNAVAENRDSLIGSLHPFDQQQIESVCQAQLTFLEYQSDLLQTRIAQHRIIEAHGDLRPEHICVLNPPLAIDCLEFNRQLRLLDPVDELAYLSLECEYLASTNIEPMLFQVYNARCFDAPAPELIHFYKSVRAMTRARLMARHLLDQPESEWPKWIDKTCRYLQLAATYSSQ